MGKKKVSKEDGIQSAKRVFDSFIKKAEKPIKVNVSKKPKKKNKNHS